MEYRILSINPGSTSTKVAVFVDTKPLFVKTIAHPIEETERFGTILDQFEFRKNYVIKTLEEQAVELSRLTAVVGRGGQLPPVKGGGYRVNRKMLDDLRNAIPHASNLGAFIAYSIAEPLGIPAYIYDAVAADELYDVAKITGIPEIRRQSFAHVLNSKAMARKAAEQLGGTYQSMNFIVAHIGGGISITAHEKGRIVDTITDDAGPFSPERSGSVPLGYVVDLCYSGKYTKKEFMDKLKKNSGLKAYLHTNDCRKIEQMIAEGNELAKQMYEAEAYQIAKGIGEMAPPLCGKIDAVILTGGMAYSKYITGEVSRRAGYLGKVIVLPGENEMEALALGALRILKGEESCNEYGQP
ncbi:MAG: butyrate kinase [Spirochaetaceae bacterium]|jgi:butyrate kinase|nr:butyrate kinase [Spirochaetaceae bacterium]